MRGRIEIVIKILLTVKEVSNYKQPYFFILLQLTN